MFPVGDRNMTLAQELLPQHGIRIAASDTGGTRGRKILFNTATGVVLMAKLGTEEAQPTLPDGRPKNPKPVS